MARKSEAAAPAEALSTTEATVAETVAALVEASSTTQIAEYNPLVAEMARLQTQYGNVVFDCSDSKGMEVAKAARVDVRAVRYAIQNAEKTVLVPYQKAVKDAQAKVNEVKEFGEGLKAQVLELETPIDDKIKVEEKRIQDEKDAKAEADRVRLEALQTKISRFRNVPSAYASRTAADIATVLESVKISVILPEEYAELEAEATIARDAAIEQLETLHGLAVTREAEAAKVIAQQKELEELREKQRVSDEAARVERERRDVEDRARLKKQQDELDAQKKELADKAAQVERDQAELRQLRANAAVAAAAPVAAPVVQPVVEAAAPSQSQTPAASILVDRLQADAAGTGNDFAPSIAVANAPTAEEIIEVVAMGFDTDLNTATQWLRALTF